MKHSLACALLGGSLWATAAAGPVVINEIHSSPDVKQERVEFVELVNTSPVGVDLGGWQFTAGIRFTFPVGTSIPPGGFIVVAEDPSALRTKFGGASALGPWIGSLSGSGETLELVDATGALQDVVDYQLGFPWPTVGDAPGYSLELIHPALDNALGGNWRASVVGDLTTRSIPLIEPRAAWRYRKGTSEPSTPTTAWREASFDDGAWETGNLPLGYDPAIGLGTPLTDMRVNGVAQYLNVYLRTRFTLAQAETVQRLRLEALYDDGFNLWINGRFLLGQFMRSTEVAFNEDATTARESDSYEPFVIDVPAGVLREGENVLCVQLANGNGGNSSDCFFDARLTALAGASRRGPTPGRTNAVFATTAPPALRQVGHFPTQPKPNDVVTISARVTDPEGVANVTLLTQIVQPGDYLALNDPDYATRWTETVMTAGTNGLYAASVPSSVQRHRVLVRYRVRAVDAQGASVTVPYADDPQPNFAYFVYGGVPAWTGAIRPGVSGDLGQVFTVPSQEMNRLPVIHLIAKRTDVEGCTWNDRSHGDEYFWPGTLVYDGRVYDHIHMRPRGGVWRYAMGKNMWKFDFNRGHDLVTRDNYGRRRSVDWTKLNLGASIQQGDFQHRGEQGLFESVGFRLFQLAGVPPLDTTLVQLRIIDDAAETVAGNQYAGDFWGLYLAIEQPDGRLLDARELPDGNLYKMEGGTGDPNNLGPNGPVNGEDLLAFQSAYGGTGYLQLSESWWRTNLNLPAYYSYQAIVQAIHHYDIGDGKNYFFYRHPGEGRWTTVPWDLDLTWADNMYRGGQGGDSPNGGGEPFRLRVLSDFKTSTRLLPLQREFRNRVREVRDLLWNTDQAWALIDEFALRLRGTNNFTLLDADRAQWDYNPVMINESLVNLSKAGHGRFYRAGVGTKDFAGMVRKMKDYVVYRGTDPTYSLDTISREAVLPPTPSLSYSGPPQFPGNRLQFTLAGPVPAAVANLQWRLGEVTLPSDAGFDSNAPRPYEITAVWESGLQPPNQTSITVPAGLTRPGSRYRSRVRYLDTEGRASHWSDPVEFVAGVPDAAAALVQHLKLTELMYHPADDGFEFIELFNASSSETLALESLRFSAGIDYTFPLNSVLPPGAYWMLVRTPATNFPAFRTYHGLPNNFPLNGPFDGSLDNGGETLTLRVGPGGPVVFSFTWGDASPWPELADGAGHSLVPLGSSLPLQNTDRINDPAHWTSSALRLGSPGRLDDAGGLIQFASVRFALGGLEVSVVTAPTTRFRLESSTDLRTWTSAASGTGPMTLTVPGASAAAQLFVRAVRQ